MTLHGTNTWVIAAPGSRELMIVDPGPDLDAHIDSVIAFAQIRNAFFSTVVHTHHHHDHVGASEKVRQRTGADLVPLAGREPSAGAAAGTACTPVDVGPAGVRCEVLPTPGHTADSVCLHLPDAAVVLTGDTVLGAGTSVVAWPDGDLGAYLASLEALRRLVVGAGVRALLPGHGPVVHDPVPVLDAYLARRRARTAQVATALGRPARPLDPADDELVGHLVRAVYPDLEPALVPAAGAGVRAVLAHLATGA